MKQNPTPDSIEQAPSLQPSSAPTAKTGNVFSKHPVWWLALLIICLVVGIVFTGRVSEQDVLWATVLGSVLGMFAVGFILSGIPYVISRLSRKCMTSQQFMSTFTGAVALAIVARIVVATVATNEKRAIEQAVAQMEREEEQLLRSLKVLDASLESNQHLSGTYNLKGRIYNQSTNLVSRVFLKISIFNPQENLNDTKFVRLVNLHLAPGDVKSFSESIDIDRVPKGFSWTYSISYAEQER